MTRHPRPRTQVFANLSSFTSLLRAELNKATLDVLSVERIFQLVELNPVEWKMYTSRVPPTGAAYTRQMVASSPKFSLFLVTWLPGQASPVHDHAGSVGWMKVLEGSVTETRYTYDAGRKLLKTVGATVHDAPFVHSLPADVIHRHENSCTFPAYTLHLYSPNYESNACYNPVTGERSCAHSASSYHLPSASM
jgi:cysteine dioxygenase